MMAFVLFLHLHFIILLMNCVIILCSCGTENCLRVTAIITWICQLLSVDMIWNNSVELDDVRTLHLLITRQATCRWRSTNERLLITVCSERSAIDRASFSVAIWTFTTRSCSDHWPIVIVLTRSIADRSMIVRVLGSAPRASRGVSE